MKRLALQYNWSIDQPWKGYDEGNVGQYWGIFTTDRALKFQLAGEVELNKYWLYQMIAAIIIGTLLTIFGLKIKSKISHAFAYAIAAQGMASFGIVMAAIYPFVNYMNFGMWLCGNKVFMIPLVIITLAKQTSYLEAQLEFNLQD